VGVFCGGNSWRGWGKGNPKEKGRKKKRVTYALKANSVNVAHDKKKGKQTRNRGRSTGRRILEAGDRERGGRGKRENKEEEFLRKVSGN